MAKFLLVQRVPSDSKNGRGPEFAAGGDKAAKPSLSEIAEPKFLLDLLALSVVSASTFETDNGGGNMNRLLLDPIVFPVHKDRRVPERMANTDGGRLRTTLRRTACRRYH